jgi:hypothetical protein
MLIKIKSLAMAKLMPLAEVLPEQLVQICFGVCQHVVAGLRQSKPSITAAAAAAAAAAAVCAGTPSTSFSTF